MSGTGSRLQNGPHPIHSLYSDFVASIVVLTFAPRNYLSYLGLSAFALAQTATSASQLSRGTGTPLRCHGKCKNNTVLRPMQGKFFVTQKFLNYHSVPSLALAACRMTASGCQFSGGRSEAESCAPMRPTCRNASHRRILHGGVHVTIQRIGDAQNRNAFKAQSIYSDSVLLASES